MPIQTNESQSFAKSVDVLVVPSPTGVTVSGRVRWFNDLYEIPNVAIACPYTDDATYRVALCSTPPRIVLVEDDATPSDEVCYLARWAFRSPTDTCETVTIDVPRRVLVPRIGDDGQPIPLPSPTVRQVSATPTLPASTPERTESRKVRRRIRELRQQVRALKDAETSVSAMTAAQRALVTELCALELGLPVFVP